MRSTAMDYGITVCGVFSLKMHNILKNFKKLYWEHLEVTGHFSYGKFRDIFCKEKATKVWKIWTLTESFDTIKNEKAYISEYFYIYFLKNALHSRNWLEMAISFFLTIPDWTMVGFMGPVSSTPFGVLFGIPVSF